MKDGAVRFILFLVVFLFSFYATSASFDCTKSTTLNEKRICSNPTLSKLDEDMAILYKKLVSKMGNALKSQQVQWIKTQRSCRDEACLIAVYEKRIDELAEELNSIIRSEGLPKDIEDLVGNWRSSNAGCRASQSASTSLKECGEREKLSRSLEALGYCFGNGTSQRDPEAHKIWQKCKR